MPVLRPSAAAPSSGILFIQEMRPGIVETEDQAVGIMLVDGGLQRVVVRRGDVIISAKLSPSRERTIRLNESKIGRACGQTGRAGYLVQVRGELQIRSVAAHIGNRRHIAVGELMLYAQLIFIDSPGRNIVRDVSLIGGVTDVEILRDLFRIRRTHHVVQHGSSIGGRLGESDQWSGALSRVRIRGATRTGCGGSKAVSIAVVIFAVVVRVHSEPAPDNRVVPDRPGKTDARQEDVVNRLLQRISVVLRSKPQ